MYTNGVTQAMVQSAYETESAEKTKKTSKVTYGKTVGEPELSEKAQKYYEKLKQKFSNMDFILVSPDKKEEAKANAGQYANANRTVVLIDTEKIERMAEDESYRKKYEGIISSSSADSLTLSPQKSANRAEVATMLRAFAEKII